MTYNSNIIAELSLQQARYLKRDKGVALFMRVELEMNNADVAALEKAVAFFVKRHESLRTIFPLIDGELKQVILPADERFALEFIDTNTLHKSYEEIRAEYFENAGVWFVDKQKDPLTKFFLFKLEGEKYMFLFLVDHISCDDWSMEKIIKKELMVFYQCYSGGGEPDIQPLKAQLRDYAEQRKTWISEKGEELKRYWKAKTSGYDYIFNISDFYDGYFLRNKQRLLAEKTIEKVETQKELFAIYDHPQALLYTTQISGQHFNAITAFAKNNNCTISAIIYASLSILLHSYTGKRKILIAAIIADRFVSENQLIIGNLLGEAYFTGDFSDRLVINDVIDQTFYDILTNCQNLIINYDYLDLDRAELRASCDMVVNYIKYYENLPDITAIQERHIDTDINHYPLKNTACEYDNGFILYWKYNKLLFDKELIEDIVECHQNILDFMIKNDDRTIGELKNYLKAKATITI